MTTQMNNTRIPKVELEYEKEVLDVARVSRTVAGGRRFSFRTTIAIGNKNGKVGVGVDKGKDVAQSIDKSYRAATKKVINVAREDGTIAAEVIGHFKSARVLLKPAKKGTGLIAGGAVRALCNLAGIENISAKILSKSNNKLNIARATLDAFNKLKRFSLDTDKAIIAPKEKILENKEITKPVTDEKSKENKGVSEKTEKKEEKDVKS